MGLSLVDQKESKTINIIDQRQLYSDKTKEVQMGPILVLLAKRVGLAPSGHCCYALSRFAVEPPILIIVGLTTVINKKPAI